MDDIVTRLRGQRTNGVLCEQAADEIERLRTENENLRSSLEEVARERDRWMGQTF